MVHELAMLLVYAFAGYVAVGVVIALAFVAAGVGRVFGAPVAVTLPARVLILPGATLLWPLVLWKWLRARRP
jgi:hypothetical protein